jgi:alcohol dehydrogenase (cytochrome c)
VQTKGGKQLLALAPKDGYLYGFDRDTNKLPYRVPATRIENADVPITQNRDVHFCPGVVGGAEWNGPAYDPQTNLILVGEVEWCITARAQDPEEVRSVSVGQPWVGMATLNPFNMFGKQSRADGHWAGWVYAVDADTGVWKWRVQTNYPVVSGMTPTAGGSFSLATWAATSMRSMPPPVKIFGAKPSMARLPAASSPTRQTVRKKLR